MFWESSHAPIRRELYSDERLDLSGRRWHRTRNGFELDGIRPLDGPTRRVISGTAALVGLPALLLWNPGLAVMSGAIAGVGGLLAAFGRPRARAITGTFRIDRSPTTLIRETGLEGLLRPPSVVLDGMVLLFDHFNHHRDMVDKNGRERLVITPLYRLSLVPRKALPALENGLVAATVDYRRRFGATPDASYDINGPRHLPYAMTLNVLSDLEFALEVARQISEATDTILLDTTTEPRALVHDVEPTPYAPGMLGAISLAGAREGGLVSLAQGDNPVPEPDAGAPPPTLRVQSAPPWLATRTRHDDHDRLKVAPPAPALGTPALLGLLFTSGVLFAIQMARSTASPLASWLGILIGPALAAGIYYVRGSSVRLDARGVTLLSGPDKSERPIRWADIRDIRPIKRLGQSALKIRTARRAYVLPVATYHRDWLQDEMYRWLQRAAWIRENR